MTNEELLEKFPECEKLNKDDVRAILEKVLLESESHEEVVSKLYDSCEEIYPEPPENKHKPWEDQDHTQFNYFWEYKDDDNPSKLTFRQWTGMVEAEFVARTGKKRTYKEACRVAAEEWHRKIFDVVFQDNGCWEGSSYNLNMLGSSIKMSAQEKITQEMKDKFLEVMEDYYYNNCRYDWENNGQKHTSYIEPSCDYGPNGPLHDIMERAGIPEKEIDSICPWKTTIRIDQLDNRVKVYGYGKVDYV